jgi:four helix bundle protein
MNYKEWEAKAPSVITSDSMWKMRAYRLALFLSDIGWHDVTRLGTDDRTTKLAGQLYRSLGSIGANLAEGYSYGTGANRAHLYEYALGSARESKEWYYRGRFIISEKVSFHRMSLLEEIIRLILTLRFAFCASAICATSNSSPSS